MDVIVGVMKWWMYFYVVTCNGGEMESQLAKV